MRGSISRQANLFVKINLEELVPADHSLRAIRRMADEAISAMGRTFAVAYAPAERGGRPSIPPERLLKALVLMSLYTVRSERALCERIAFDTLFRWFLDMIPDERGFDHSDFTNFRERLDRLDITKKFSDRIVMMAMDAGVHQPGPLLHRRLAAAEPRLAQEPQADRAAQGRGGGTR